MKDIEYTVCDYLVMESVYGDRNHEEIIERRQKLKQVIDETQIRGGIILIPAFSLERTQSILYDLNFLIEEKKIKSIPVFLDSPLAIHITEIYKKYTELFNEKVQEQIKSGDDIFSFPHLQLVRERINSLQIEKERGSKIIIAGSGMSEGGRIVSHEKELLGDKRNTLLLVGYQSPGTLGRLFKDGEKRVMIDGEKMVVEAAVENISGYSSHRDLNGLLDFVEHGGKIKKVFVTMGEPKASLFLAQRIRDYLGIAVVVPEIGTHYELD